MPIGKNTKEPENPNEKVISQIAEAEILIQRLNSLYNQFFTGIEKRQPLELRARLDALIAQIIQAPKMTPQVKFRFQGLQAHYALYRDRWEKQIKKKTEG